MAGKTLDRRIPRKGMKLNEALKIAIQMADALAKAHVAGIICRDLKPSNMMVTEDGQLKLDFGLAKLTEILEGTEGTTRTAQSLIEAGTFPRLNQRCFSECGLRHSPSHRPVRSK